MRTLVGKVMSLLFKILSRFAIAFLTRSRRLLISCLLSPSAVIMNVHSCLLAERKLWMQLYVLNFEPELCSVACFSEYVCYDKLVWVEFLN